MANQPAPRLTEIISDLLRKHNHPNPTQWALYVHKDAHESEDVNIQRFLINRYWREVIGMYPENTLSVRECLIDTGHIEDWIRLFETGVIPCILRNTLHRSTS